MREQLKPQDLLVALKLVAHKGEPWTYKGLADSLHMSRSEVHGAAKRLERSRLYNRVTDRIVRLHLLEFLVHGVRYAFPAEEGEPSKGVPTAWSASPLKGSTVGGTAAVWPTRHGKTAGNSVPPLYRSAPDAAATDPALYEWLALVDALRVGRVRERKLAADEVARRLM